MADLTDDRSAVPFGLTTPALRRLIFDPRATNVDVPVLQCQISHSALVEVGVHALFVGGVAAAHNQWTSEGYDMDRFVQWGRILSRINRAAIELGLLVPDIAHALQTGQDDDTDASIVRAYFGALSLLQHNSLAQRHISHFLQSRGQQIERFNHFTHQSNQSADEENVPPAFPSLPSWNAPSPLSAMDKEPTPPVLYGATSEEMARQPTFWLNQLAVQRGYSINFGFESTGAPHNLTWTASLFLVRPGADGPALFATGVGSSKAEAKNKASGAALMELRWMPED